MSSKRLLVAVLVGSVAVGCGGETTDSATVLVLLGSLDDPFVRELRAGIEDAWRASGDRTPLTVRGAVDGRDETTQVAVLRDMNRELVAGRSSPALRGVLLHPAAPAAALGPEIDRLRAAGVPVVVLERRLADAAGSAPPSFAIDGFVGTDGGAAALLAARVVARRAPGGGAILVLGLRDTRACPSRAFRAGLLELGRTLSVSYDVTERGCDGRREEARDTVRGLLARERRFAAIFAENDEMALGAALAFADAPPETRPVIVGFDGTQEARRAVAAGRLTATIARDPRETGRRAVELLVRLRAHQTAADAVIGPTLIE